MGKFGKSYLFSSGCSDSSFDGLDLSTAKRKLTMPLRNKIKEVTVEHTAELLLGILALLLGPTWLVLRSLLSRHILPALSKETLAGLLALTTILLLLAIAYVFYLRKKIKGKLVHKFGVMWSKDRVPYCPGCSKPLGRFECHNVKESLWGRWGFWCIQCSQVVSMSDDNGTILKLKDALEQWPAEN